LLVNLSHLGTIAGSAIIALFFTSSQYFASRTFLLTFLYVTVSCTATIAFDSSLSTSKEPFQTRCEVRCFCIKQRSLWSLVFQTLYSW